MTRAAMLLIALAALALVVLSFLFLIKPKSDEVTELREEAETVRAEQSQVRSQIAALEDIRSNSPSFEAELAAISAIVPDNPALPSTLRQLQMAADASGVTLVSVAPTAPSSAEVADIPELSLINLTLNLEGGYFQVVDFLRRVEDPQITARGILVADVGMNPAEYPVLNVSVTAQMFSMLDQPAAAEATPDSGPTQDPTATEDATGDDDADVEVDVNVTEEDAA